MLLLLLLLLQHSKVARHTFTYSFASQSGHYCLKQLASVAADHIVAVYQGGGLCDLENLRTLCVICHQASAVSLLILLLLCFCLSPSLCFGQIQMCQPKPSCGHTQSQFHYFVILGILAFALSDIVHCHVMFLNCQNKPVQSNS